MAGSAPPPPKRGRCDDGEGSELPRLFIPGAAASGGGGSGGGGGGSGGSSSGGGGGGGERLLVVDPAFNVLCPRVYREPAAAAATGDKQPPRDVLVEALTTVVEKTRVKETDDASTLFLDPDRTTVLENLASVVHSFDARTASGNIFGRMILGLKGAGKTTFLQAMVLAIARCAKRTVAGYFNVDAFTGPASSWHACVPPRATQTTSCRQPWTRRISVWSCERWARSVCTSSWC